VIWKTTLQNQAPTTCGESYANFAVAMICGEIVKSLNDDSLVNFL
jgi:hypothetical protein